MGGAKRNGTISSTDGAVLAKIRALPKKQLTQPVVAVNKLTALCRFAGRGSRSCKGFGTKSCNAGFEVGRANVVKVGQTNTSFWMQVAVKAHLKGYVELCGIAAEMALAEDFLARCMREAPSRRRSTPKSVRPNRRTD